jgi:hypothetical protein
VIDLRIDNGTFVRGHREAIANRGVDGYEIANNMIGKAHIVDRESGAFHGVFKIHPTFSQSEALKPTVFGTILDSIPLSRDIIHRPGSVVFV